MKKWIVMVLFIMISFTMCNVEDSLAGSSDRPLSFSSQTLEGETFSSNIFQYYDLVMVNIWAEWAGPCLTEISELEKIHKQYPNVLLIGAYIDENYSGAIQAARNEASFCGERERGGGRVGNYAAGDEAAGS